MTEQTDEFLEEQGLETQDVSVLKNLSQMGETLKQLHLKLLEAEAEAERAKKEYEHYANVLIPMQMFSAGVDTIGLATGGVLKVKRNYYCQPNKNDVDRKIISDWLRKNGGEHLVKHDATVSAEDMAKLDAESIPYIENTSVNTTSLKAFLKDKIGATTGVQQIKPEDIPACIHFQIVNTVELEV